MAKVARQGMTIRRQGRRAMGVIRRKGRTAGAALKARTLTVGELIAAAFDTVGHEVKDVARLLASPDLACAIQKRIVLVR